MEYTYIREQRTHVLDNMLSAKEYEAFLVAYLDTRTDNPFWPGPWSENISHAYVLMTSLQFTSLMSWAGLALLERLIDEGACLNSVECLLTTWKYDCGTHLTPLAAACVRGDPQVFDLLSRRGAQMYARHGSEQCWGGLAKGDIINAAATYMAKTGDSSPLEAVSCCWPRHQPDVLHSAADCAPVLGGVAFNPPPHVQDPSSHISLCCQGLVWDACGLQTFDDLPRCRLPC